MTMLVTLEQAKAHLRIDTADEDADLTLKIHAASSAVMNYLKSAIIFEPAIVDGILVYTTVVRFEIQAAVLLMVGYLYKDRDSDPDREYEPGMLPRPVTALLYPLRTPSLA